MRTPFHLAALAAAWFAHGAPAVAQNAVPNLVEDIQPGPGASTPLWLTDVDGKLFFRADDGVNGIEPWVSDGTAAGTSLLGDLEPLGSSFPTGFAGLGGEAFFFTAPNKLWKSDGTPAGTVLLKDFVVPGSPPAMMESAGGVLFFAANDGIVGRELWKTDGTVAGTVLVQDIRPGPVSSIQQVGILEFASIGNEIYFVADDGVSGGEIWKSDGTAAGTQLVYDAYYGVTGSSPYYLTAAGNYLWFRANFASYVFPIGWFYLGFEPARYDPVTGIVSRIDLNPGPPDSFPFNLSASGATIYFGADGGATGREPWKIDATLTPTALGDLNPGSASSLGYGVSFHSIGSRVYFTATDGILGAEPWSTDGTPGGTSLLRDLQAGAGSSYPYGFADADGTVLFSAETAGDREIWRSDGTGAGTLPFFEINPTGSANAALLTKSGDQIFFIADDGVSGTELHTFSRLLSGEVYCTAGTSVGTSAPKCTSRISSTGVASASQASGFTVSATAPLNRTGLLFYGTNGRQANPWGNGNSYQCVVPPVQRTPMQDSGGFGKCKGSYVLDFNAFTSANPSKRPSVGALVQIQAWYRDPQNTSNQTTALSDALEFTYCP